MPLDMLDIMSEDSSKDGKAPAGVDEEVFRRNQAEMRDIVMKMGADQRPPEQELNRLRNRLFTLKAECEGQPPPEEAVSASQGPKIAQFSGSSGVVGAKAAALKHDVFQGGGSRLGGESTAASASPSAGSTAALASSSAGYNATCPPVQLREVDPEKPVVRIQVQLLDKRPARISVNRDFTVRDLRAWLAHYQGPESCSYHLMDVSNFPPKRLSDLDVTMDAAGLTAKSALACRPA